MAAMPRAVTEAAKLLGARGLRSRWNDMSASERSEFARQLVNRREEKRREREDEQLAESEA